MPSRARMKRIFLGGLLWMFLLDFGFMALSLETGFLDFDNLPDTNFTCVGKVIGGYYADLETNCQMFHVCTIGQADEPMDIRFLCLNGTVFDQETRVCERIDEVDCTKSEQFYSLNLELYGNSGPILEEAPDVPQETEPPSIIIKPTTPTITTTTTTRRLATKSPHYFTTIQPPAATTVHQALSGHHFPVNNADIRFNPEEINISLNARAPPDIRTKHYQPNKAEGPTAVRGVQKPNGDPDFGFSIDEFQSTEPPHQQQQFLIQTNSFRHSQSYPHNSHQYHHPQFHSTTVKQPTNFHQDPGQTTVRTVYLQTLKPATEVHQHHFTHHPRTEKTPQRVQIPIPLLPTLPPLTFSSPAPFTLQHRIDSKRYTKDHHEPPKIIISASASVSDASGRRLNYSLGTIGSAQILETPPSSYDEYKDSDVGLDPFFHDVPKLQNQGRRRRRSKREAVPKQNLNPFDIIKNEKEAVEVLKFLFTWYQSHQATATVPSVTSPVSPELIKEINFELASTTERSSTDTATSTEPLDRNTEESVQFSEKMDVTVTDAKEFSINPNDYVDDNYEGVVYKETKDTDSHAAAISELYKYFNVNQQLATEQATTTTSEAPPRRRGRGRQRQVDSFQEASYNANVAKPVPNSIDGDKPKNRRGKNRSRSRFATTTTPTTTIAPSTTTTTTTTMPPSTTIDESFVETATPYSTETTEQSSTTTESYGDDIKYTHYEAEHVYEKTTESGIDAINSTVAITETDKTTELETSTLTATIEASTHSMTETFEESTYIDTTTKQFVDNPSYLIKLLKYYADTATPASPDMETSYETATQNDATTTPTSNQLDSTSEVLPTLRDIYDGSIYLKKEKSKPDLLNKLSSIIDKLNDDSVTVLPSISDTTVTTPLVNFEEKNSYGTTYSTVTEQSTAARELTRMFEVTTENYNNESFSDDVFFTPKGSVTEHINSVAESKTDFPSTVEETTQTSLQPNTNAPEVEIQKSISLPISLLDIDDIHKDINGLVAENKPNTLDVFSTLPTTQTTLEEHLTYLQNTTLAPVEQNATEILLFRNTKTMNSSHLLEVLLETTTPFRPVTVVTSTKRPAPKRKPYGNRNQFGRHRFSTELFTNKPSKSDGDVNYQRNLLVTDAPLQKSASPTRSELRKVSLRTTPLSSKDYKLSGKVSKHYVFNCFGKEKNRFYADPRDCRLFHYCTQGYSKNQLLDLKYVCDQKTFFDEDKLICTKVKPVRCL